MTTPRSNALVFFDATGDLAHRKIFPSLQTMVRRSQLDIPVEGVAPALMERLEEVIERLRSGGGRTIVVSDSTLDRTKQVYDRYLMIERGGNEMEKSLAPQSFE